MPDSNRGKRNQALAGLFCALALLGPIFIAYALGSLSGEQEGRHVEAGAYHEANAKQQAADTCANVLPAGMFECVYDTVESAQESQRSEQDLSAQQGMHFWAVAMVIVGTLQTLVAGAALWFLKADLQQNRRSAEQQLRAYILPNTAELKFNDKGAPLAELELKNFGQTPAVEVQSWVHLWVHDFPLTQPLPRPKDGEVMQGSGFIGPGSTSEYVQERKFVLNIFEKLNIQEGTAALYLYGEVEYKDVFGQRRTTEYIFFTNSKVGYERGRFSPYLVGNKMT